MPAEEGLPTHSMNAKFDKAPLHSNMILCLAPNAAYQLTVLFDQIALGQVNRATMQTNSLGGKGQNFAVATKQYYKNADNVTLLQILGGPTGIQIEAMENEQGFHYITNMQTGEMTEMVGVSGRIDKAAEEDYETTAKKILQSPEPPRALALCGTFPPGLNSTTVARIVSSRVPAKTIVFVDAVKDIHPVLESRCIDILKVNSGEVINILSVLDAKNGGESKYGDANRAATLDLAAARLAGTYNIGVVAVTDGPETAYLVDRAESKSYAFSIPDLLADREYFLGDSNSDDHGNLVLNPLGAGDTCSAVMLNLLMEGRRVEEAFAQGLAAASASCLVTMPNCVFDRKVMERIRGRISVRAINH